MKGVKKVRQNDSFINDICDICGGVDVDGKALSETQIVCGYGSEYDGETINVRMCGKCVDMIYKSFREQRGNLIGCRKQKSI